MTILPQRVVPMGSPYGLPSSDPHFDRNLGAAYNAAMELLRDDQWAAFIDHDAWWTTREWYAQIVEAVDFRPEAGAFTAMANRIGCDWQKAGDPDNYDMRWHRAFGEERRHTRTLLDITETSGMGGVVIVVSKAAWRASGGFPDGMLCVDHQFHFALERAGWRVFVIEGLYVGHWRRACNDNLPRDTPRASKCPCRERPETRPTHRLTLPGRAWKKISRD